MEISNELQTRIDAYLEDGMPPKDRVAFESDLQENASLKAEVDLQRDARNLLVLYDQVAYKEVLKEVDAEYEAEKEANQSPRVVPLWKRPVWIAAAAVVSLLIATFLLTPSYSNDALLAEAFDHYPDIVQNRSAGEDDAALLQAMYAYTNQEFSRAVSLFQPLATARPKSDTIQFYYGLSLIGEGKASDALPIFERMSHEEDGYFAELVSYNYALALLDAGKIEEGKVQLKKLAEDPYHYYREKATTLLQKWDHPLRSLPGVK
ncbi:MAG: hypothetical protein AAFR61_31270 [Bacteroidota bacterium]